MKVKGISSFEAQFQMWETHYHAPLFCEHCQDGGGGKLHFNLKVHKYSAYKTVTLHGVVKDFICHQSYYNKTIIGHSVGPSTDNNG